MTTTSRAQHGAATEVEVAEIASRVRVAVGRLSRRLRLQPGADRLTSTQLAALITIEQRGPLRIGDLTAAEGISAATMTQVVTALEEHDLVQRRPDPDDRRACQVLLSPHGESQLTQLRSQSTGYLATRLQACTPEQRATLAAALPVLELIAHDVPMQT